MNNPEPKVLIVDDEPDLREILQDYVEDAIPSAKVLPAGDGEEALAAAKSQKFDLVITDMRMPKMGGATLLASLGKLPAELKPGAILVISGEYSEESVTRISGKVTFFTKPVNKVLLQKHIRKSCGILTVEDSAKEAKFQIDVIRPFIESTASVLRTISQVEIKKETIFVRKSQEMSGDVSGFVGMNSEDYFGSFAISFGESTFLTILERMIGEKFEAITPENQDAAAEVSNLIFGMVKKILNEKGHTIQPAIPSVISGKGHSIKYAVLGVCVAVRLESDIGDILLEVMVKDKS